MVISETQEAFASRMGVSPKFPDPINNPKHYTSHPSGIECIEVTEHMSFNLGNAIKYLWRADEKGAPLQDLQKAAWYINREIEKRTHATTATGDKK